MNGERKGELCLSLSSLLTRQGKCQRDRNELVLHLDEAASEFKDFLNILWPFILPLLGFFHEMLRFHLSRNSVWKL